MRVAAAAVAAAIDAAISAAAVPAAVATDVAVACGLPMSVAEDAIRRQPLDQSVLCHINI